MNETETTRRCSRLEWYVWALAAMWTVAIAASIAWDMATVTQNTLEVARIQVLAAYEKDVLYRRWNTGHWGVYVPVTQATQPLPVPSS